MKYSSVTISGGICTGKSTIRDLLHKKLGWESFSTGSVFRTYANEHNLSIDTAEEQDKLAGDVDKAVYERLKSEKNLIVDSWMAGVNGKDMEHLLRVLLVCDDEERIKRFIERESVNQPEAQKRINAREGKLLKKLSEMYNIDDILDPKHYNIVIDTTRKTPEQIVETILSSLT